MEDSLYNGALGTVDYRRHAAHLRTPEAAPAALVGSRTDAPGVQQDETDALRRRVAQLERELAETRFAARASEASQLGKTLLAYVLDVLCTLLLPQRGQTIIAELAGARVRAEAGDSQCSIGPLQMALERPSFMRALQGRTGSVTTRFECALWIPVWQGSGVAVILCLRRTLDRPFSEYEQQLSETLVLQRDRKERGW